MGSKKITGQSFFKRAAIVRCTIGGTVIDYPYRTQAEGYRSFEVFQRSWALLPENEARKIELFSYGVSNARWENETMGKLAQVYEENQTSFVNGEQKSTLVKKRVPFFATGVRTAQSNLTDNQQHVYEIHFSEKPPYADFKKEFPYENYQISFDSDPTRRIIASTIAEAIKEDPLGECGPLWLTKQGRYYKIVDEFPE